MSDVRTSKNQRLTGYCTYTSLRDHADATFWTPNTQEFNNQIYFEVTYESGNLPVFDWNLESKRDIDLVVQQTGCSKLAAARALVYHRYDIVNAIMDLSDNAIGEYKRLVVGIRSESHNIVSWNVLDGSVAFSEAIEPEIIHHRCEIGDTFGVYYSTQGLILTLNGRVVKQQGCCYDSDVLPFVTVSDKCSYTVNFGRDRINHPLLWDALDNNYREKLRKNVLKDISVISYAKSQ